MDLKMVEEHIANNTFYHCTAWRKLRSIVVDRDNHECKVCGIIEQKARLYVHHKKELKDYPHLALDMNNLITVCGNCHNDIHEKGEQLRQYDNKKKFINEERW